MTLWVDLREVPVKRRLPYRKAANKAGARILVASGDAQADGDVLVHDGTRVLDGTAEAAQWIRIRSPQDQEAASKAGGAVVVEADDWTVIPLENLIAARRDRPGTLLAVARDAGEARLFLQTLETGVHGIVLRPASPRDVRAVQDLLESRPRPADVASDAASDGPLSLTVARVSGITDAGMGDRVCVDTTSALRRGEGLLVGSTARQQCLVEAEVHESGYVAPRPFRVNAGALHAYAVVPGGRTRYLSELRAGDEVLAVDDAGQTRTVTVGRAKIERRPHVLVRWAAEGVEGSMVLQLAETVRLLGPEQSVAVTDLEVGASILVHVQEAARHSGMPVDSRLEER